MKTNHRLNCHCDLADIAAIMSDNAPPIVAKDIKEIINSRLGLVCICLADFAGIYGSELDNIWTQSNHILETFENELFKRYNPNNSFLEISGLEKIARICLSRAFEELDHRLNYENDSN
jgi:hypothetical protein